MDAVHVSIPLTVYNNLAPEDETTSEGLCINNNDDLSESHSCNGHGLNMCTTETNDVDNQGPLGNRESSPSVNLSLSDVELQPDMSEPEGCEDQRQTVIDCGSDSNLDQCTTSHVLAESDASLYENNIVEVCDSLMEDEQVGKTSPSPESARHLLQNGSNVSGLCIPLNNRALNVSSDDILQEASNQREAVEVFGNSFDCHKDVDDTDPTKHKKHSMRWDVFEFMTKF